MFTGLIEEIGRIQKTSPAGHGRRFSISARQILEDLKVGDSVSVNGVCLTAEVLAPDGFECTAVEESLRRSTLEQVKKGDPVNLERALKLQDRLGGHMVQGHVDGKGMIRDIRKKEGHYLLSISLSPDLYRYTIEKGSIAVDGVSLTIARKTGGLVDIAVIPHTWQATTLGNLEKGSAVNIEVDMIAKYIEQFSGSGKAATGMSDADWIAFLS